ncbi:MAG TPA: hypothetical protein VLA52_01080 [Thermohalobaculum sp.]|nr:hypothetical protein [Thermohalobaculum sp.]
MRLLSLKTGSILALALSPLAASPLYPMVDYYHHTVRMFYLSGASRFSEFDQYYEADWGLYPNIVGDLVGIAFFAVFDPVTASRLFLTFLLATIFSGCMSLARADGCRALPLTAILCGLFLFHQSFHFGLSNFMLGFGLGLFAIAFWVRTRDAGRWRLALAGAAAFSAPLYLAHGFAYMIFGLIVFAYEIGFAAERGRLRSIQLFRVAVGLLLTAIPAVALLVYTGFSGQGSHASLIERVRNHLDQGTLLESVAQRAVDRLSILPRQFETDIATFDYLFSGAAVLAIAVLLISRGATVRQRWVWVFATLGLAYLTIPRIFFGVSYVAERIPFVALILFAAVVRPRDAHAGRRAMAAFLCLLALRSAALIYDWGGDAAAQRGALAWSRVFRPGDIVISVNPLRRLDEEFHPHCQMFPAPFAWTAGVGVYTFANEGVQPLRVKGRLAEVLENLGNPLPIEVIEEAPVFNGLQFDRAIASGADYVVTCHPGLFSADPGTKARLVAQSGPYVLYAAHAHRDR